MHMISQATRNAEWLCEFVEEFLELVGLSIEIIFGLSFDGASVM